MTGQFHFVTNTIVLPDTPHRNPRVASALVIREDFAQSVSYVGSCKTSEPETVSLGFNVLYDV